eukprot:scaffold293_cov121-Isochrysis_galbana.AAC.8
MVGGARRVQATSHVWTAEDQARLHRIGERRRHGRPHLYGVLKLAHAAVTSAPWPHRQRAGSRQHDGKGQRRRRLGKSNRPAHTSDRPSTCTPSLHAWTDQEGSGAAGGVHHSVL